MKKLRAAIKRALPKGFVEEMSYGMIGYVVPLSLYPAGYHCDTKLPLPLINVASQKNSISVYHLGMYQNPSLLSWFRAAWAKATPLKLDMGKSCVRLKQLDQIPYDVFGELAGKLTPAQWVALYEKSLKRRTP